MKTLLVTSRKGGTGKSTFATQFAYYLSEYKSKRTLFIDLDDHGTTTSLVIAGGVAEVLPYNSAHMLYGNFPQAPHQLAEGKKMAFLPSVPEVISVIEHVDKEKNNHIAMFSDYLDLNRSQFDYCVIDTAASLDVRLFGSYIVSDFVIAPIQVMQEAIETAPSVLAEIITFQATKRERGRNLEFIGFLPSMFTKTPLQKKNFLDLVSVYHTHMIPLGKHHYAAIKLRSIIEEAQGNGVPFWSIKKTMTREAIDEIFPLFDAVLKRMDGGK